MHVERADELADFAIYCRGVEADTVGTAARTIWRERAEWADTCAADFRRAEEALRQIVAFEVDPDDGWDYSVGVMRAIAADALDDLGRQ